MQHYLTILSLFSLWFLITIKPNQIKPNQKQNKYHYLTILSLILFGFLSHIIVQYKPNQKQTQNKNQTETK